MKAKLPGEGKNSILNNKLALHENEVTKYNHDKTDAHARAYPCTYTYTYTYENITTKIFHNQQQQQKSK